METIVIYQSSTGFTKQYAQWIAEELGCNVLDMKSVSKESINQYEHIIFGGWIMGNMISGLNKIIKMNPKKLTVFAVGSTPASEEVEKAIRTQNHLEETPFFYFEGGFHFEKLSFPVKMMLKMMKKSVAKKENKTPQDEYMVKILGTSFDHTDKKFIAPLIDIYKGTAD